MVVSDLRRGGDGDVGPSAVLAEQLEGTQAAEVDSVSRARDLVRQPQPRLVGEALAIQQQHRLLANWVRKKYAHHGSSL